MRKRGAAGGNRNVAQEPLATIGSAEQGRSDHRFANRHSGLSGVAKDAARNAPRDLEQSPSLWKFARSQHSLRAHEIEAISKSIAGEEAELRLAIDRSVDASQPNEYPAVVGKATAREIPRCVVLEESRFNCLQMWLVDLDTSFFGVVASLSKSFALAQQGIVRFVVSEEVGARLFAFDDDGL